MSTNAQAALQAAATVYEGGRGHSSPDTITGLASIFKRWLDRQDREDKQVWRKEDHDRAVGEQDRILREASHPMT